MFWGHGPALVDAGMNHVEIGKNPYQSRHWHDSLRLPHPRDTIRSAHVSIDFLHQRR
jgi:hypothetical protein